MWIKNNQTYSTHSDIRKACPNTSFPSVLTDQMILDTGFIPVTMLSAPNFDQTTQRIEKAVPEGSDGVWTCGWDVIDLTAEELEANRRASVPQTVSIRQACQALEEVGLLENIELAIAASPRSLQIDWQRATSVERNWPTLMLVQRQMNITDEQLDALFVRASQL